MSDKAADNLPKIFLYCVSGQFANGDVVALALAQDGVGLATHVSNSPENAKLDLGYTTEKKHDTYRQHYPHGFILEWVGSTEEDLKANGDFMAAYKLNERLNTPK
jgi:hypothetical protein